MSEDTVLKMETASPVELEDSVNNDLDSENLKQEIVGEMNSSEEIRSTCPESNPNEFTRFLASKRTKYSQEDITPSSSMEGVNITVENFEIPSRTTFGPRKKWVNKNPISNMGPSSIAEGETEIEPSLDDVEKNEETENFDSTENMNSKKPLEFKILEERVQRLNNENLKLTLENENLKKELEQEQAKSASLVYDNTSLSLKNENLNEKLKYCSNLAIKIAKERDEAEAKLPEKKIVDYSAMYHKLRATRKKERLEVVITAIRSITGNSENEEEIDKSQKCIVNDIEKHYSSES